GGPALPHAARAAWDDVPLAGDEAPGVEIVRGAISQPLHWIAANAGLEGAGVVQKGSGPDTNRGFNAETGDYEDLLAAGVVDPVKVTKAALQNAASIAGTILSTQGAVVDKPEEPEQATA